MPCPSRLTCANFSRSHLESRERPPNDMNKFIAIPAIATLLLLGISSAALLAYDAVVVRPHLAEIHKLVTHPEGYHACPPRIIRDLIHASTGPPVWYATRLVTKRAYSDLTQGGWHVRNTLWGILLQLHLDEDEMYCIVATLAYNGTDVGLANLARREFGLSLAELSPTQAATVVAITLYPSYFLQNRERLERRARMLLEASANADQQE